MSDRTAKQLLSGNEAVALAARDYGVTLGVGYPGTPSTEILENLDRFGGRAQWAPNEKVALEVAIGVAFGGGAALATMKHVGVNVAADPLFTAAYTVNDGPLVLVSADDPGMASSQNEQDNRRYAVAAGVPMLEPSDSQEAYDMTIAAMELSREFHKPVMLRLTTRICHSKTVVEPHPPSEQFVPAREYRRDIQGRVMIPAFARGAHKRLRETLAQIACWAETSPLNRIEQRDSSLGIITSGISYAHVREAAPEASVLKLGISCPVPLAMAREFAASVDRCVVVEEGDHFLVERLRVAGIDVEGKPEQYRFGELTVERVRGILNQEIGDEFVPPRGKPPALCQGCPHRLAYDVLKQLNCIIAGDIGCYTLGVLPPFETMDTCVCMGASIGVALGLRHTLPEDEARRVVSVIGDSTFVHSGITGLVDMVYNPPATGHVVIILDNSTTAMTGLQEHPGTGRKLNYEPAAQLDYIALAKSIGIDNVQVMDVSKERDRFEKALREALGSGELSLLIARKPCILALAKEKKMEKLQTGGV